MLPEHLTGGGLIEAGPDSTPANSLENADGSEASHVRRVVWQVEADPNVTLSCQVVDFLGLDLVDEVLEASCTTHIAVVKQEACFVVRVIIEMVNATGVEGTRTPDQPMYLIAFKEKKLGEIRTVLASDACDKSFFHEIRSEAL